MSDSPRPLDSSPPPAGTPSATADTAVVIVAAGASARFARSAGQDQAGRLAKPFLSLAGATVLEHACAAFAPLERVRELVVVARAEDVEAVRELARRSKALARVRAVVAGGAERFDSVCAGVAATAREVALIAVHDAARPLVSSEVVRRALEVAERTGAALVATPVRDTIKTSATGERAESTLDRTVLWAAQTPQVFRAALLRDFMERARTDGFKPTDEAALHERYAGPIAIVESDSTNLKITTLADFAVAEALLRARQHAPGGGR